MAPRAAASPIIVRAPRQPAPIVRVNMPRATPTARLARKAGGIARRGATKAAHAAWDERHTLVALGTAGVLGYMEGSGQQPLPHIQQLGVYGTYGIALWGAGRMLKSTMLSHAATGLLCVAINRAARESGGGGGGGAGPGQLGPLPERRQGVSGQL